MQPVHFAAQWALEAAECYVRPMTAACHLRTAARRCPFLGLACRRLGKTSVLIVLSSKRNPALLMISWTLKYAYLPRRPYSESFGAPVRPHRTRSARLRRLGSHHPGCGFRPALLMLDANQEDPCNTGARARFTLSCRTASAQDRSAVPSGRHPEVIESS
jgi:hypothetical protein